MIPVLIGAAAAVAASAYALSSDDKSNGDWVVEKTQTTVPVEEVPARIREKIRRGEMHYVVYYKSDEVWLQETKHGLMFAEAVPEKILSKANVAEKEVDITDYIENEWEESK